jgi:hypothetical protein
MAVTGVADPASQGGKARAAKLTPERRSEIAKAGAMKRWHGPQKAAELRPVPVAVPMIKDNGVREHHGVTTWDQGNVRIYEATSDLIAIRIFDGSSPSSFAERKLTPPMARYLADRLYELAQRVDKRRGQ